jgi:hypothetical protein
MKSLECTLVDTLADDFTNAIQTLEQKGPERVRVQAGETSLAP